MTYDGEFAAALDLLERVPRPPGMRAVTGASIGQLEALGDLLGYSVPESVRAWLGLCNGAVAGPGGLYGSEVEWDFLNIGFVLNLYPDWRGRKWLPIAGDGNGNHYVVDVSRTHLIVDGVFFVDVCDDPMGLAYIVASDLSRFLNFLLNRELGIRQWPFDRDYVLGRDPIVGSVSPLSLLPWG